MVALTKLQVGLESFGIALTFWRYLLGTPQGCDYLCEQADFWEELSYGWMKEYIWPYDDMYNSTVSPQRKLRLGRR
jgi:hypothetical protein